MIDPETWRRYELAASGDFCDEVLQWLRHGLAVHKECGGKVALEKCLGIAAAPGERRAHTSADYVARDRWIAAAWSELDPSGGERRETGLQLLKEIAIFEEDYWPAWHELSAPPPGTTPLRDALFRLFQVHAKRLPTRWRALRDSVRRARSSCGTSNEKNKVKSPNYQEGMSWIGCIPPTARNKR